MLATRGSLLQFAAIRNGDFNIVRLPIDHLIENEIEIVGSVGNPHAAYPELLGLVERGVLRPEALVGETVPLEQAGHVIESMDQYDTLGFTVITSF